MLTIFYALMTLLTGLALADIKIQKMKSSYSASSGVDLEWKDDGSDPALSELTTVTFMLCTGSNSDIDCLDPLLYTGDLNALKGEKTLPLTEVQAKGGNGPYFIQMNAVDAKSGNSMHYSPRFKLTGMTGSKKASDGGDTEPPPPQVDAGQMDDADITKEGKKTYTKQTGRTRVAPMQTQPGTKVTRKLSASQRHPTSKVDGYFSTIKPNPKVASTLTPGWDYTFSALTNYAKTQPTPTKFYAATAAQKSAIAHSKKPTQAPKTKRWVS